MLEFVLFTFFSSFEYVAIIMIAFAIYRIRFKNIAFHLLFISLSLSYVSFTMRDHVGIESFAPIIQIMVLFLFIWLMFRIQVFYALLITVTGYFSLVIDQGLLIVLLDFLGVIIFEQVAPSTMIGYYIQMLTAAVLIVLSSIVEKFNWGFDFVPHSEFAKVRMRHENTIILSIILVAFLIFLVTYSLVMYNKLINGFQIIVMTNIVALALLIYFARKKDKKEE